MGKFKIEIKWAIVFVIVALLWKLGENLTGLHSTHIDKQHYGSLLIIPTIVIYVLNLLDKRKNFYNSKMNFLQAFSTGMSLTLMITLLSPVIQFLSYTIISPEYFTNAINHTVELGRATPEEAATFYNLKNYIFLNIRSVLISGIMITLMVSGIISLIWLFLEERKRGMTM